MKETEIKTKDQVAEVRQVQAKKKKQLIGSLVRGDGHILYEFNRTNFELRKGTMEKALNANFMKPNDPAAHPKVSVKENCYYFFALNEKNAVRKVMKRFPFVPCVAVVDQDED